MAEPIRCSVGGCLVQILRGARRVETPRMNIPVSTGFNRSVVGSVSLEEEHTCTHLNIFASQQCVRTEPEIKRDYFYFVTRNTTPSLTT